MNSNIAEKQKKYVKISDLIRELDFDIAIVGDLDRYIDTPNIYQIGYELLGYFDYDRTEVKRSVHVCGNKEFMYMNTLPPDKKEQLFEKYFSYKFPALVLTNEHILSDNILNIARKYKITVLQSKNKTPETIRILKYYLLRRLIEETVLPGYFFLEIYGVGMLLTGYEDAKLGVTIELLERGHKLITDDNVKVRRLAENELEGCNRFDKTKADSHFFILNKKDGSKIDVTTQFGIKATRSKKKIDLLIVLEEWNEKKFYDRLGLDVVYGEILGEKIPKLVIPVRKGRNLAVILETAAVNHRMKAMGESSAEYFVKESQKMIDEKEKNKAEGKMSDNTYITVRKLKNEFGLKVLSGEELLDSTLVKTTTIHRPALALSGFVDMYKDPKNICVQIFSDVEFKYLESLPEDIRKENLKKYFSFKFPLLVLTVDVKVPDYFFEMVQKNNIILCRSPYKRSSQLVANFNGYLETYFAKSISLHGVFIESYGFGILLTGKSGIGKSETALELIHRGHRLVADDLVTFVQDTAGTVLGRAARLPFFMEIRGLGIIDIKALYGLGAVRVNKRLDVVIELKEQDKDDYLTSVDYESSTEEILGKKFPKIVLYISSGRNAAAMVEIAIMNLMAKMLGHDPEKLYREGIKRMTEEERNILEGKK